MQDLLRDSWLYQEIMQEGYDKGIEQGIEKGIEQGIEKGIEKGREEEREEWLLRQRQLLMTIIQMHFPNTVSLARQQVDAIKEPEVLQSLIFKVLESQTEEQATECLLSIN